jgi:ribonuclease G
VGSRSKSSATTLEDTITKNNIEAVSEVVRQLRLRDIGGIIVIDFIDMANPKNRATVEEALRTELERDRTKTYVVEISPLGLVEMTRQNVTEGPREVLTKKCPTCGGDGIVLSERTGAVHAERHIRTLVRGSRSKAFHIVLNARVAEILVGPGAKRLQELEGAVNRTLVLEGREDLPLDHVEVAGHGSVEKIVSEPAIPEGSELTVKLAEVGRHDVGAGIGAHKGLTVAVADAAKLVGKRPKVRVERVLGDTAYATLVDPAPKDLTPPITAESQAEKPTRSKTARPKKAAASVVEETVVEEEAPPEEEPEQVEATEEQKPRKKTRRGTRGGRGRKRKPAVAPVSVDGDQPTPEATPEPAAEPARIHIPAHDLGQNGPAADSTNGDEPAKPKKKTRRGSRGGRGRKRKTPTPAAE